MSLSSITPGSYFGDAVSQNGYGFEYLGKLYLFTYRQIDDAFADDRHFRCMRSTDAGATWAEVGTGPQWPIDTPSGLNSGFPIAYTVGLDGSNAILLWVNGTKSPLTALNWINLTISKVVFNLTSNSWGTVTTASASFMGLMDTQDQVSTTTHSNRTSIQLIVRGPSNYLVYVPGAQSGTGTSLRAKAAVVPYDGGSFGSPIPIPGQASNKWYMPCGSVYDPASGNTHLLMAGGIPAGGQPNIYHVTMDSGNAYGSLSTVIDSGTSPGDMNASTNTGPDGVSQPIIYLDGTSRKVAFVSSVFGAGPTFPILVRFFSGTEALNPTFTHSEISADQSIVPQDIPRFAAHAEVFSLAANSTTLIATWISFNGVPDQPSDIYYSTSPATGTPTWSTPISVIPTPAALPIGGGGTSPYVNVQGLAFPVTGGFGIFGTAQQHGNYTPSFVSQFSFVAVASPPAPPTVSCGDPPDGRVGTPYSHTMPTTHTGTFTVTVTAGALPDGLTMNSTGLITGTPTVAGSFIYTATITDTVGTGAVDCTITINASSLGLGCASPPDGVVGVEYLHTFPVSGGTPPYTFAIISGILPPGLTLDSLTGQVSGTPTLAGDYEFTVQVSDDFGSTVGTCDITITVTDEPASGIGCDSPPEGEIGVPYSHTFPVTDIPSGATVTYSITGGALPPGLTLNTSTGQVTGTPTTDGHYHFTVTATIT